MAASHPSLDTGEAPSGRPAATGAASAVAPAPHAVASDPRFESAKNAAGRAEASLSSLMRVVRDLGTGIASAREANSSLSTELLQLAELLGAANERQLALKNRVTFLEQALSHAQKEASRERAYILEQQDAFIAGLLDEHEREVDDLSKELGATRERLSQRPTAMPVPAGDTEPPGPLDVKAELEAANVEIEKLLEERARTRETLLRVQAQRDEAQATVGDLTRERDQARAEAARHRIGDAVRQALPVGHTPNQGLRVAPTLPPPEAAQKSPSSKPPRAVPSSQPGSAGRRRAGMVVEPTPVTGEARATGSSPYHPRPKAPALELSPRQFRSASPPPEELAAAVHPPSRRPTPPGLGFVDPPVTEPPSAEPPPPPASDPKRAPQQSLRPAGGYSLTNSVAPEQVNTSQLSRPPRR